MALKAKQSTGNSNNVSKQEPIEAGTYPCRVVQLLDLGVQAQQPWKGKEKPPVQMISITYEFLDEFCLDENGEEMEDKPRWLSEDMPLYSLGAENAKSTKRYMALDPKVVHDGDFSKLLDTPCMVTINESPSKKNPDKIYNNVTTISAMRKRDAGKAPELVNPPKLFMLDEPDLDVFSSLPEWIQDKIKGNLEFEGSLLQSMLEGGSSKKKKVEKEEEDFDEDVPFKEEEEEDDGEW